MSSIFKFKQFAITQEHSALKLGTDAVLLGCAARFSSPTNILDIGTGTGILALMMAQRFNCSITAIDIDENAIKDAEINFAASKWTKNIQLQHKSVQDFTNEQKEEFDGIICNPPFFSNSLTNNDKSKTIARHTVNLTPEILFSCIYKLLNNNGTAYIIIPCSEKIRFIQAAVENNLYATHTILIYPFANSENPNRTIIEFRKNWKEFGTEEIHIRNADKTYTHLFKELTKDFYL
ncbi:MAG: methyltransferase [Bacteroidales bacterium]|nr:methyltransferase [Bacteroidales bacterium]